MLNVLCVRVGPKYSTDYVYKLKNMVERHLKQPHKFYCITDNPAKLPGIDCIAAPIQINDSWCKIGLFAPSLQKIKEREECLYLDLDVIITGSLDELIEGKLKSTIIDDVESPSKDLWIAKDWRDPFNSSVMYWVHGQKGRIFGAFTQEHIETLRGDQNLIAELMPDARTFDMKDIQSYKFDGIHKKDEKPKCKIVLFHGKPKMTDLPNVQWIKKEWK